MTEVEIRTFLAQYTELEKMFLKYASLAKITELSPSLVQDTQDEKKMPVSKIDLKQLLVPGKLMFDEKSYIPDGENIAFRVHPRFIRIPEHRHSFIEMLYVFSGGCTQSVNGIQIPMKEGDLCILDTNVHHSIEAAGSGDIIIDCLMRKAYFDNTFMSQLAENDLMSCFFARAIYQDKKYNQYILFHAQENQILNQMIVNVLCEYFDKGICSDSLIKSYMIIIFTELLRTYQSNISSYEKTEIKAADQSEVGAIIHYINTHCETVTLESAARRFGYHPSTLCTILKKYGGTRFTDIVHQARLQRACLLLRTTDMTIESIVNEIGYLNMTFFYRIFKQYCGVTPSEYRKQAD
ncbi:MAG TPA: AraC family transcriptional regulator [Caproiciproducens sp.]|nr:AraC family transcriptional regulator [Caproiciproducens sp.]